MRSRTVLCAVALVLNVTNATAQNAPVTDCDKLAASPDDPQRKAPGVALSKIKPKMAIPACETAVGKFPNDARFNFQLGRAYSRAKNYQTAVEHYKKSAEQDYLSAQFNLGTMYYNGHGTAKDYVRAYMWFSLSGEDVASAVAKQKMVRRMSPAQIARAQEMTSQCKAQNLRNCD